MGAEPSRGTDARPPLSRRRIISEALRQIDSRGLDALSMRTLGGALDVQAMSIYRHVPSKAALLDGVVERLLEELEFVPGASVSWQEAMAAFARSYRGIALRHPEAFRLFVQRPETGYLAAQGATEDMLARLQQAGFSEDEAILALRTITRFVIGFCLGAPPPGRERGADAAPRIDGSTGAERLVAGLADPDDTALFEFGLAALAAGLVPGQSSGRWPVPERQRASAIGGA